VTPSHRHAISSFAALMLAACQAPPSTPSTSTQAKPDVDAPAPSQTPVAKSQPQPPPATTPPPPLGSTRVYLLIGDRGDQGDQIVRFDEHGAASLPSHTSSAFEDLFEGPDGAVYVRDRDALHRIEGEQLIEVVRFPAEINPVHHLTLGRDGSIWVVSEQGIGVRTDDAWKLTTLAELELDADTKLAFDSEQTLWAVGPRRALYREHDSWLPAPTELLAPEYALLNPVGSPVGRVHVSNHHLLTRLGKQNFDSVVIDGKTRVSYTADLDIAPDGYACVATEGCDLACANDKPPTIIWRFPSKNDTCESVYEIAVEASHRVWVASPQGLSLILPERDVHHFTVAEHPLLAGPVTEMVVVD
jgi:ligand-binding sensor domain-containing protein